jgi:hypothetical protein
MRRSSRRLATPDLLTDYFVVFRAQQRAPSSAEMKFSARRVMPAVRRIKKEDVMVKDILDVARALFERRDVIIKSQKERCDLLAKYFEGIGDTLKQIAESFRKNQVPRGQIAEMVTYAKLLPQSVGSHLELMDIDELTRKLGQVEQVESLSLEVEANREEAISQIEEASGVFKALGASCRIHY